MNMTIKAACILCAILYSICISTAQTLGTPSEIKCTDNGAQNFTIEWKEVNGATRYAVKVVEKGKPKGNTRTFMTKATSASIPNVDARRYQFYVIAYNGKGSTKSTIHNFAVASNIHRVYGIKTNVSEENGKISVYSVLDDFPATLYDAKGKKLQQIKLNTGEGEFEKVPAGEYSVTVFDETIKIEVE